jgi:4-hydroxybenzoate polyprenyltransferase
MFSALVRLARPAQWLKNGVIPLSLIFAGRLTEITRVEFTILATAYFCLLSSALYIFNDILDRESDRQHPGKKDRPLAARTVSIGTAATMSLFLLLGGMAGCWLISRDLFFVALLFVGFNLLYSLALKHVAIVDVIAVALSFVFRAYAGAVTADVPASKWMIITTLLLALFLALGKRRYELTMLEAGGTEHRKALSHYSSYILDQMIGVTTASVVVVYMLWSFSSEVSERLGTENLYLTIPFVVYGIFRYLYLIHRREKGGFPTQILLTDPGIALTVLLWLFTSIAILYWK